MGQVRINPDGLNLNDKVVSINRVTKVVKGGRRFRFSAVVVIGDGNGVVATGYGKAKEVPEAIRKAIGRAKKELLRVPLKRTTLPYDVVGHFGAEDVLLKPAPAGTGIIAGGAVRAVMEMLGVRDVFSKCFGSGNPVNVVKATMQALQQFCDREARFEKNDQARGEEASQGGATADDYADTKLDRATTEA